MIDLLKEIESICVGALNSNNADIKKELKDCKKDFKAIDKILTKIYKKIGV